VPIPVQFNGRLAIPAVAAPMFLVSGPDLVVECCRAGIIGTFPALNCRSSEGYEAWLVEIRERLDRIARDTGRPSAPFGVNLIVHKSNPRLQADLDLSIKHKVPLIITSLGAVKELVGAVQGYGGLVFHDVINVRHARKAAEAGVDGLIAVCAGAGGHAGLLSPFALIPEIRAFFPKTILLSGVMSTGRHIAAARMLGADLAYLGTRFIATRESLAVPKFKEMIVATNAADIVYTAAISGVHGNFLKPSIDAAGAAIDLAATGKQLNLDHETRAWKDVWSAGQGVGSIADVPTTAELCERLIREYREAMSETAETFANAPAAKEPAAGSAAA
jgi:nitronate monooxygenase